MSNAYSDDLAFIHDAGFTGFAESAAKVLLRELQGRDHSGGRVIDLGCGSGALSLPLSQAGYDVLGIDVSESFLAIARERVPKAEFVCGSMFDVAFPECVGVAAIGECVNYLFDESDSEGRLVELFRRVHTALRPGGTFLFDAAGPGRAGATGESRGYTEGDGWLVAYLAIEQSDPPRLSRTITSFRRDGALYRRTDECHELRLIPREDIVRELEQTGFRVSVLDGYGDTKFPPGWSGFLATKD